jgi:hypothetical protein
MPMSPRLLRPIARSGDSDVRAFIAAVEFADQQPLEQAVKDAYRDFIVGCKADGIWTAFRTCGFLMGARTLSGALTPLVGPAPSNVNFVSGDYDRKTGLVGDATTKQLDIDFNPSTLPQDDISMAAFISNRGIATGRALIDSGRALAGASSIIMDRRLRSRSSTLSTPSGTATAGFFGWSRNNSANVSTLFDTTSGTVTVSSETPHNGNIRLFNSSTGGSLFSDASIQFWATGLSMNISSLRDRLVAFDAAIGAAIP